jgi:hypothetical protein
VLVPVVMLKTKAADAGEHDQRHGEHRHRRQVCVGERQGGVRSCAAVQIAHGQPAAERQQRAQTQRQRQLQPAEQKKGIGDRKPGDSACTPESRRAEKVRHRRATRPPRPPPAAPVVRPHAWGDRRPSPGRRARRPACSADSRVGREQQAETHGRVGGYVVLRDDSAIGRYQPQRQLERARVVAGHFQFDGQHLPERQRRQAAQRVDRDLRPGRRGG